MKITPREKGERWGDFHARSRFAHSTIPEEKWGTTRILFSFGLARLVLHANIHLLWSLIGSNNLSFGVT